MSEKKAILEIRGLYAGIEGKEILKGLDLTVKQGEVHAIMGPNGSGKSTLALALMGHPKYHIHSGKVLLNNEDLLALSPDERARKGLFLAFQYPSEVQGVGFSNFLRIAYNSMHAGSSTGEKQKQVSPMQFQQTFREKLGELHMAPDFARRYLNHGFSGGEKKRSEILQMGVLKPKIAVLDEIDSGLDIDALKVIAGAISKQAADTGFIVITHYQRILKHLNPDKVHVMVDGKIVKSGGHELATRLEEQGYAGLLKELGIKYVEASEAPAAGDAHV